MSVTFAPEWKPEDGRIAGVSFDEEANLNVSTSNAYRMLRALDIVPDYCGSIGADDLIGRIHLALAVGPKDIVDTADPATKGLLASLSSGGATVIDCSRPLDEYLDSRLPALLVVARTAQEMCRDVTWA